ncbi:hypothetical protein HPP92_027711 [Vanilla planifolia]|uniref:Uncharacterized protein n=1 Tax=Vanilla planifolia TaxID=51239 RepID=A0A835PVF6_VANPL|nr:hypothetical protein HPP92_027711 [Vanilla planifolia]KAG0461060.1 hypothetical protein HPP92_021357 [Vanilla planifolia]
MIIASTSLADLCHELELASEAPAASTEFCFQLNSKTTASRKPSRREANQEELIVLYGLNPVVSDRYRRGRGVRQTEKDEF